MNTLSLGLGGKTASAWALCQYLLGCNITENDRILSLIEFQLMIITIMSIKALVALRVLHL